MAMTMTSNWPPHPDVADISGWLHVGDVVRVALAHLNIDCRVTDVRSDPDGRGAIQWLTLRGESSCGPFLADGFQHDAGCGPSARCDQVVLAWR